MKKKIIITSAILVVIPLILFTILYCIMVYVVYNTGEDYSEQIQGCWLGTQYLHNKELKLCSDESELSIIVKKDTVVISGDLLEPGEYSYKWNNGSTMQIDYLGKPCIFVVSINSIEQLKITISSMDYIITLNKDEKNNANADI